MIRLGASLRQEAGIFTGVPDQNAPISSRQFSTFAGPKASRVATQPFRVKAFSDVSGSIFQSSLPYCCPTATTCNSRSTPPTGAWLQCSLLRQLHSSQTSELLDVREVRYIAVACLLCLHP
jgi:hypothetical protein